MLPEEMLSNLNDAGENAGSDYRDGLDGWFGWRIDGDILTVHFEGSHINERYRRQWTLTRREVVAG